MQTPQKDPQLLIEEMTAYMTQCMSGHDPSHNPAHVHRVVSLAHRILASELARNPSTAPAMYDKHVVTLAATLHDIGDHKYLPQQPSSPSTTTAGSEESEVVVDPKQMVHNILLSHDADAGLAARIQKIVSNVSYSNEIKNPTQIRALIAQQGFHELAIVQDADRLDAIGAVGIARTFTYLGSQGSKRKKNGQEDVPEWELDESIGHFGEKLEKLEGMMKTETGREMARERTRRLQEFKAWWVEETAPFTG